MRGRRGDVPDLYFGGSFDPPHLGHLYAAQEALDRGGFRHVLFVPTGANPLKGAVEGASGADRLEMVRRAISGNEAFALSEAEIHTERPSYTVETIERLIASGDLGGRDGSRPGLMIGDDLLDQLHRWRDIERLFSIVRLVVVRRSAAVEIPAVLPRDALFVDTAPVPISSREIRQRLREGASIRYLVPDSVYEYIEHTGIYRPAD